MIKRDNRVQTDCFIWYICGFRLIFESTYWYNSPNSFVWWSILLIVLSRRNSSSPFHHQMGRPILKSEMIEIRAADVKILAQLCRRWQPCWHGFWLNVMKWPEAGYGTQWFETRSLPHHFPAVRARAGHICSVPFPTICIMGTGRELTSCASPEGFQWASVWKSIRTTEARVVSRYYSSLFLHEH